MPPIVSTAIINIWALDVAFPFTDVASAFASAFAPSTAATSLSFLSVPCPLTAGVPSLLPPAGCGTGWQLRILLPHSPAHRSPANPRCCSGGDQFISATHVQGAQGSARIGCVMLREVVSLIQNPWSHRPSLANKESWTPVVRSEARRVETRLKRRLCRARRAWHGLQPYP